MDESGKLFSERGFLFLYQKHQVFVGVHCSRNRRAAKATLFLPVRSGGKYDNLIPSDHDQERQRFSLTMDEADALGLEIDHTDDLAISGSDDFALGDSRQRSQRGVKPAKPFQPIEKKGFTGYSVTTNV